MKPLSPRQALLQRLLLNAGANGVTTAEILQAGVGSRYGQRIKELRDDHGLVITAVRETQSRWRYTLVFDVERGGAPAACPHPQTTAVAPPAASAASLDIDGLFDTRKYVRRYGYKDQEAA